ncbi:MAG: hypothetical protein WCK92_10870 [Bacteroidota bacterium]
MKLYSYIVTSDTGFSPNPFWGKCTLACCKPIIRKTADPGDWVVGIRGKSLYNKLGLEKTSDASTTYKIIYAMKVSEKISFKDYFRRFPEKRPDYSKAEAIYNRGDNCYKPLGNGDYKQLESMHTRKNKEKNKEKDLNGKFVLIADQFYYFGSKPLDIPENLSNLICGRGHKCDFDKSTQNIFREYITSRKFGVKARPSLWNENDKSWKQ